MKKYLLFLIIIPLLFGCSTNSPNNNNPYLPSYQVNTEINLSLPQYSDLKFVANGVYIPNQGVRGIFIFNTSGTTYNAFDAACPNQALSACSTMTFKKLDPLDPLKIDKTRVVCACDNAEYSLFSGQSTGKQYPLRQYRVEVNGNVLRVYN
jgi:nitrite reductase/ring-hydroxylating ferredoxin subunit